MNNTKIGNKTEKMISKILKENGYWSVIFPKSQSGSQPFDILGIKKKNNNCYVFCIDSKHVRIEDISFKLERVEDNQKISMLYCHNFAGMDIETMGFVIYFERTQKLYWFAFSKFLDLEEKQVKSIKMDLLEEFENFIKNY